MFWVEMAESDNKSGWYASVKYIMDGKKEYVPITAISEIGQGGVKTPFRPAKLTDFKFGKVYCIKTITGSTDGGVHPYNGIIGRLAESKEAMKSDKVRTNWPPITHEMRTFSEQDSSGNEESHRRKHSVLVRSRTHNKSVLINKRQAQTKELESLASLKFFDLLEDQLIPLKESSGPEVNLISSHSPSRSTSPNFVSLSSLSPLDSSPPHNSTPSQCSPSPTVLSGRDLIQTMKERIKCFEEQLDNERKANASETSLQGIRDYIDQKFKDFNSSIESTIGAVVDKKVAPLADILSKSPSPTNKSYVQEWVNNIPE